MTPLPMNTETKIHVLYKQSEEENMLLAVLHTMLYSAHPQGISINIKIHYRAHWIGGLKYFVSNAFLCSTYITISHEFQNMKNTESTLTQNWTKFMSLGILTGQLSTPNGKNL